MCVMGFRSACYCMFISVFVCDMKGKNLDEQCNHWRFSAFRKKRKQKGQKDALRDLKTVSLKTVCVSVFCLPKPGFGDRWNTFMGLSGGHKARQTGALVRPLCVRALPVLTQGDLVADVLTLVYVCRKRRQKTLVSRAIRQLPAAHLLLSGLMGGCMS